MKKNVRQAQHVPVTDTSRARSQAADQRPHEAHLCAACIIVIGGDLCVRRLEKLFDGLRVYPSARFAGFGSRRRALATISSGSVLLVFMLCRSIGHSDSNAITERCRRANVHWVPVWGGFSAARREIRTALERR